MQLPENYAQFPAADRVDLVCDAFEETYRSGGSPRIEEFLSTSLPVDRETLLSELVWLDIDYRRRRGDPPTADEYLARFPDDSAALTPRILSDLESASQSVQSTVVQRGMAVVEATFKAESRPAAELGRYRLNVLIGRGAYGEVWRAHDPVLDRDVALKTLRSDRQYPPSTVSRFLDEGRKLARLKHPGIVPVYDVGHDQGRCFIVSEFIAGETLAERLERDGRMPPADAVAIAADVADALHAAHREGIVHRDVKPSNILLDERGRPHLADFGLAITEEEQLEEPAATVGTYAFMSPEQIRGDSRHVDARTDLYGLGVVLYRMLTGRLPFQARTDEQWRELILQREPPPLRTNDEMIPGDLERIVLKCLSKKVSDRDTTAADLARALRRCAEPAVAPAGRKWRPLVRWATIAAGLALATSLGLALGGMFTPQKSALDLHAAQVLPVTPISDDPFAERVTNSWGVSPDGKAIEISSLRRETKLQIGTYDGQGTLDLEIELEQPDWDGGVGLFFGVHDDEREVEFGRLYQWVAIYRSEMVPPAPPQVTYSLHVNVWSELGRSGMTLAHVDIPKPDSASVKLRVLVDGDKLKNVYYCGKECPELMEQYRQLRELAESRDYLLDGRGRFGLYCSTASGVFKNPRLNGLAFSFRDNSRGGNH
jgi:tRNA A-37 threonylcarbamoyl transferase component Bud32